MNIHRSFIFYDFFFNLVNAYSYYGCVDTTMWLDIFGDFDALTVENCSAVIAEQPYYLNDDSFTMNYLYSRINNTVENCLQACSTLLGFTYAAINNG